MKPRQERRALWKVNSALNSLVVSYALLRKTTEDEQQIVEHIDKLDRKWRVFCHKWAKKRLSTGIKPKPEAFLEQIQKLHNV